MGFTVNEGVNSKTSTTPVTNAYFTLGVCDEVTSSNGTDRTYRVDACIYESKAARDAHMKTIGMIRQVTITLPVADFATTTVAAKWAAFYTELKARVTELYPGATFVDDN